MSKETLVIKMIHDAWKMQIGRANKLINELSDEQLLGEVAPGRNTGLYLLGHLVAVHDAMMPLLGLGDLKYPNLDIIFLKNPDKSGLQKPSASEIRKAWTDVNEVLSAAISKLSEEQWFQRHTSVSPEDFEKEPHRNRLNILISRTNHLAYHIGQLIFLK